MAREQKSIKKNTIYNMLKTFSSIIFPLITFPYVSRVLSPVGIGRYNFSSTYVAISASSPRWALQLMQLESAQRLEMIRRS